MFIPFNTLPDCAVYINSMISFLCAINELYHRIKCSNAQNSLLTNGLLQEEHTELQVLAHPLALSILENLRLQRLQPYRRLMWGWPKSSKGKQIMDGEMIRTENFNFQMIYTPGHSADHICLYGSERGWLFN